MMFLYVGYLVFFFLVVDLSVVYIKIFIIIKICKIKVFDIFKEIFISLYVRKKCCNVFISVNLIVEN